MNVKPCTLYGYDPRNSADRVEFQRLMRKKVFSGRDAVLIHQGNRDEPAPTVPTGKDGAGGFDPYYAH